MNISFLKAIEKTVIEMDKAKNITKMENIMKENLRIMSIFQ